MKSIIVSALILVLLPAVAAAQSLEGVWKADEIIVTGGEEAGSHRDLQPSLVIYTKSHYSVMVVPGLEPRALLSDDPSDEERLAAFDAFIANAGRYEFDGSTLTMTASVAMSPNVMSGGSMSGKIEWDGKDAYWIIFGEGPDESRAHWVRVED